MNFFVNYKVLFSSISLIILSKMVKNKWFDIKISRNKQMSYLTFKFLII